VPLLDAPEPTPIVWAADRFLLCDINLFVGEGGSRKSTVMLANLCALAGGYRALGHFTVGEPCACLLVSGEDDLNVIQNRIGALIRGAGWDRERVLGNLHVHALDGVLLDDPLWQAKLVEEVGELGIKALGFDPLSDLMRGSTELNADAAPVIRFWRRLVALGCTVVVNHHVAKPPGDPTAPRERIHRIRGASSWANAARMAWWVEGHETDTALACLKASRTRRPEPLRLVHTLRTDPDNEAMWTEATMTLASGSTTGDTLSDLDLGVLGVLCKALNAPSSTDVRLLVRRQGVKANNEEVAASVAGLLAAGLIRWERVGKAKAWSPTDEGRAAYARVRGERKNAE
jgi:hypothetical protein